MCVKKDYGMNVLRTMFSTYICCKQNVSVRITYDLFAAQSA